MTTCPERHVCRIMRVKMTWYRRLCTYVLAFTLQLRKILKTSARRPSMKAVPQMRSLTSKWGRWDRRACQGSRRNERRRGLSRTGIVVEMVVLTMHYPYTYYSIIHLQTSSHMAVAIMESNQKISLSLVLFSFPFLYFLSLSLSLSYWLTLFEEM